MLSILRFYVRARERKALLTWVFEVRHSAQSSVQAACVSIEIDFCHTFGMYGTTV